MSAISRRRVVQGTGAVGLGLLAGCGRWPGQAQGPTRVPRIGYLTNGGSISREYAGFFQGLAGLGYVEGQNLVVEKRFAEGQPERLPVMAGELVRLPVDAIVAPGARAVSAAKEATSTIPIVMTGTGDPVELGFIASLAHPGGNITGLSHLAGPLAGKRLELLRELAPGVSQVAVLWDSRSRSNTLQWTATQRAAQMLGVQAQPWEVRGPADLEAAFEVTRSERAGALIAIHGQLLERQRERVAQLAAESRLPAMYTQREYVAAGGLASYGPNFYELAGRSATYVDKILKGTSPADLPIEQPMTFEFVINLRTAQALGLTLPPHVLLQATEVIQ
jgi:putative tryptophan/tyrosine transport system substrate-binding protein